VITPKTPRETCAALNSSGFSVGEQDLISPFPLINLKAIIWVLIVPKSVPVPWVPVQID